MQGASPFNGGWVCFSGGSFIFKWGGTPWGGISFDGGVQKKSLDGGGMPPMPSTTMENPGHYQ